MAERRHRPRVVVPPLEYPKGPQLPPRRGAPVDPPMPTLHPPRHFLMRVKRDGPLVPARLWLCGFEPGEPTNLLDRGRLSLYPRADIAGLEADPAQLFDRLVSPTDWQPANPITHWRYMQPITQADYAFRVRQLQWASAHQPSEPGLRPKAAVKPSQLPLPSFDRENAL